MSNLEQKILDGPRIHYCDAGDDDKRVDEPDADIKLHDETQATQDESATTPTSNSSYCENDNHESTAAFRKVDSGSGPRMRLEKIGRSETLASCSFNTGPKGVIHDFKRQVTRTNKPTESSDDIDVEFRHLLADDSILEEFKAKMLKEFRTAPVFGYVKHVKSGDEFLKHLDEENPNVLVISHVFRKFSHTCSTLNRCLEELAKKYQRIKFLSIDAGVVGLSNNFVENGVPALLVYKGGNLVKSLVSLEEQLDRDFDIDQVKELLKQNNII